MRKKGKGSLGWVVDRGLLPPGGGRMLGSLFIDRGRLERLHSVEAMMPSPQDPERFSFWVGSPMLVRYKGGIALFSPLHIGNFMCT
ncbi:unnamed protein product [Prunus armeniaca]